MPIQANVDGILDIENATLRARNIVSLANMVAGNDIVRVSDAPTLEVYGDPNNGGTEPILELVSNVTDGSANAFTRLTSNAGVFNIQSGTGSATDSKGDITFTSIGGNTEHVRIQGSTSTMQISGHIIPTSNEQYDIGSAAFKIRDMYVSDNSLWIGDDTKLSVTGGELKFRKRNTGVVPKGITDMGGSGSAALSHAGVADIKNMKLQHWVDYAKSVDAAKTTKDVFTDDAENYETSAIKALNASNVMTIGTTKTFVVTVSDASGANKYYIDGYIKQSLTLHRHQTYIFDLSSSTLGEHPFVFQTTNTNDGTTNGTNYDTGITNSGTLRTFVVPADAPATLYYYCTQHSGMGGTISISSEAELIVSGRIECIGTTGISLGGGTTAQRPTYAPPGSMRYNSTTGFMEAYAVSGWAPIAQPPTVTGISPLTTASSGGSVADIWTGEVLSLIHI